MEWLLASRELLLSDFGVFGRIGLIVFHSIFLISSKSRIILTFSILLISAVDTHPLSHRIRQDSSECQLPSPR